MTSPHQTSVDLPIETFGGRVTQYDAQSLPVGASPFNQDVVFSGANPSGQGLVKGWATRPGMAPFFAAPFAGNPTVNYIKTFIDSSLITHLLTLDGAGNMRDETPSTIPPVVPNIIGTVIAASIAQSDSLFGREWIAISSPTHPGFGIDIPRQWDGTNFDRVSQVGPGAPPSVQDYIEVEALNNGAAATPYFSNISAISMSGRLVTVVSSNIFLLANRSYQVGDLVQVKGTTGGLYDGSFPIAQILNINVAILEYPSALGLAPDNTGTVGYNIVGFFTTAVPVGILGQIGVVSGITDPTFNNGGGNPANWGIRGNDGANYLFMYVPGNSRSVSGAAGGTVTIAGNISTGLHQVSVSFITREQYVTKPSPFGFWNPAGSLSVLVTNIPIGPPNIIGRIVMFTPVITSPATSGPFFYFDGNVPTPSAGIFSSMVINDNTTTTMVFDFLDAVLENGVSATNLFNLLELGECATVVSYSNRTFWAGERNKVPNLVNLTFDGGFTMGGVAPPLGWNNNNAGSSTGGSSAIAGGNLPYWGDAYVITGDGVTAVRGMITQTAYQDYLGVPIININTAYSVRVRAYKGGGLNTGGFNIEFYSPSLGGIYGTVYIDHSALGVAYAEFSPAILTPQASLPSDLLLRVYSSGTMNLGGYVVLDCIEIYPTVQPYNSSQVRASYAGDPESFDQVTGKLILTDAIGQSVRRMFTLLDNKLYIVTERGLFVTQDDGANEPSSWAINTVSATVGTGSINGVGVGESWAVIAHRTGLWIFWGGEPVKISQEIQPDWDTINWNADQWIYCVVDTINKRIHVGAPNLNGIDGPSAYPNMELVCDYSQLANAEGSVTAQDIASHPQAYYSVYNPTKVVAPGKARKWTIWNLTMNSAAMTVHADSSYHLLRGNGGYVGNGLVYDQIPTQLSDNGVAIPSQYQTAYFPQIEDEQQLQLGSHRKDCIYLTGYAFGSGVASFTMFGAQDQRSVPLSSLTLINPAHWDFEKNINFSAERMSILISTNAVGSWIEMTKLCPTIQRTVVTPVRGVA